MTEDPRGRGTYEPVGEATLEDHDGRTLRFEAGSTTVEVTALAPDLFRVGAFPNGRPARYDSEAVERSEWEDFEVSVEETDEGYTLSTGRVVARVETSPLRVSFSDGEGRVFCADEEERGMGFYRTPGSDVFTKPLGDAIGLYKRRESGERTFGCGQRTGALEKSATHQTFYNVDPPAGHTDSFDNLYSSTPFTLTLTDGLARGLFFDNPRRARFDLGKEDPEVNSYEAAGGDIVYYVFTGPTPREVLQSYTALTGRTPMPPMWALGNQQCRWSYETEGEVRRVAREFRERGIPCDVIYLDIDYMDGYRVFTWDEAAFPAPEAMISSLEEDGFDVVAIVDPGVKVDENYPVYREGRERGYFVGTAGGETFENDVWPGLCAFPDFASEEVRRWWGENHRAMVEAGVSGIWCDMNEPSLFVPRQSTMPPDAVHDSDGQRRRHGELHNAYGQMMVESVREGLLKLRPEKRPFVISRSGYAGLQRHAMQWMGDNSSWWEHLHLAMPQLMNVGLSGVAHAGVDIGGFFGDADGELLARFTEFGVFQPFCRNHSAKGTISQEPWAFGERYEDVCREMISLRMRLLPYLYTLFEECHRTGAPILRPLLFEYPSDETTYTADDEFLLGDALLVAPITRPGIEHRHVYLPEGDWSHYWSGERFEGPAHILAHAPLGRPAMYVKANTALPLAPLRMNTKEPQGALTYEIHASRGSGESTLYEDSGEGFGYESGEYSRRKVSCETTAEGVTVYIGKREGSFEPERTEIRVELHGIERRPRGVAINKAETLFEFDEERGILTVSSEESAQDTLIEVTYAQ